MNTMIHTRKRFALALLLALGLHAQLPAQTAPAAAPAQPAEEKALVLDTFTVNTEKDNGYIAVDSLAGGRQAAPIRVTPAAMSSITGQFINDLGITNVQDALKWSLATVPTAAASPAARVAACSTSGPSASGVTPTCRAATRRRRITSRSS